MESPKQPSPQVIEMRIIMTGDQLTVNGPISNKILSLGMLAAAQDCILDFHKKQVPSALATMPSIMNGSKMGQA